MPGPLPPYPPITRATLRQSLLDRLNSAAFWGNPDELNAYIAEALVTWQAYARYFRFPVSFSTHGGNFFFDLSQEVPKLARTSTDSQVLSAIEFSLLEVQSGIPSSPTWQGTSQFQQDLFTDAIARRRDRFLLETASVIGRFSTPSVSAGVNRVVLPSSLIDVRRVSWVDTLGNQTVLWRDDEFAANAFSPGWFSEPGLPVTYSVVSTQPFTLQLIPAPADEGYLDLLAIDQGPPLNPASGVVLGTPDNYAWAIKFGAMSDILAQDGPGTDVERSQHCQQRWQEGVQLCRSMPVVINASINGQSCQLDSVANFDSYAVGWNNKTTPYTPPIFLALAGQNILATSSVPDPSTPFSISLDCVVNCPLPADDSTPINISADQAQAILNEAEYLALLKEGGAEFAAAIRLHENFVQQAALYRARSNASAPYWQAMSRSNQLEFSQRPVWR